VEGEEERLEWQQKCAGDSSTGVAHTPCWPTLHHGLTLINWLSVCLCALLHCTR